MHKNFIKKIEEEFLSDFTIYDVDNSENQILYNVYDSNNIFYSYIFSFIDEKESFYLKIKTMNENAENNLTKYFDFNKTAEIFNFIYFTALKYSIFREVSKPKLNKNFKISHTDDFYLLDINDQSSFFIFNTKIATTNKNKIANSKINIYYSFQLIDNVIKPTTSFSLKYENHIIDLNLDSDLALLKLIIENFYKEKAVNMINRHLQSNDSYDIKEEDILEKIKIVKLLNY